VNGKSVADDNGAFRDLPFDPDAADASSDYARVADAVLGFAPDVVIFSGSSAAVKEVLVPVEERWKKNVARPTYASIASIAPALLDFVGTDADRRRRVFGVAPPASTPANLQFVTRYAELYPDDHVTRTNAPNTSFDAFYLLAYATYALPLHAEVTGPALATAFSRLKPPGKRTDVGMPGIFDAYAELTAGRTIDLVGATGELDLDAATGEAALDEAILCVAPDAGGRAVDGVESGLVYSASRKKLVGKMRCP
jgi:ABC-type branched-subunit amino acid transport system substrate-binding protein